MGGRGIVLIYKTESGSFNLVFYSQIATCYRNSMIINYYFQIVSRYKNMCPLFAKLARINVKLASKSSLIFDLDYSIDC